MVGFHEHIHGLVQERRNSSALAMELWLSCINSLAPGRFHSNFRQVIFKLILVNGGWGISYEIALRWMPLDLTDDKSILVPSGNKPLPEPMLTQIYVAKWRH